MATSQGRFIFEIDGMPAVVATEVTLGAKKQTPFKHQPGNQPNPDLGRGNFEVEEMTAKHAHGVGVAGEAFARYMDLYLAGLVTEKLNCRLLIMDEGGLFPIQTWDLIDCVPTSFKPETHQGSGTEVSQFSFGLTPTDQRMV